MDPFQDGMRGGRIAVNGEGKVNANNNQSLPPLVPYGSQPNQGQQQQQYYMNQPPAAYPEGQQRRQQQQPQGTQPNAQNGSGDWSSVDDFLQKFYHSPQAGKDGNGQQESHMGGQGGQQPQNQPQGNGQQQEEFDLMGLNSSHFSTVAQNMDFTTGLPDEVLQYFQPDENGQTPNMLKGIMQMMNHVARNSYANSLAGAGRVAGLGLQHYDGKVRKDLPNMMKRTAANQVVNNLQLHESLRPSIDAMVDRVLTNNPDATPELIQEMVQGFVGILRSGGNQQGNNGDDGRGNGIGDLFNF